MTFTRRYLHAGKLDIHRHEVYSLRVMQDVFDGGDKLVVQHLGHHTKAIRSGWGLPRLMVGLVWGAQYTTSAFFPVCARPAVRLAQLVVLVTPPSGSQGRLLVCSFWFTFNLIEYEYEILSCDKN